MNGSSTFRIMAVSLAPKTQDKASLSSFLDQKESGFLHFVKYHGLGNDFILVRNAPFLLVIVLLSELNYPFSISSVKKFAQIPSNYVVCVN